MATNQVELNADVSVDLPRLIESRLLIQANSGGGKSWAIRRLLEQSHGKVQQIVLDPEGEFGTLREKYDYILAGKGGDLVAEPKYAAKLAEKLLETRASTIIDLYELHPQERKRFVRLFLEAMVNVRKELYHEVLIIIDEAHVFVPQNGESEAASAVIDLMTRGRKRGFCGVLATQRISKLHKDAAAECNNKLIGRTSQDVDMKRAAEELGFTRKEDMLSLRTLKPGQFYAFGPAISDEVKQLVIGTVKTSHPKIGSRSLGKVPPASAAIKKILGQLADLPAEAEEEARTVSELKKQLALAKQHKCPVAQEDPETTKRAIDQAVKEAERRKDEEFFKQREEWLRQMDNWIKIIRELGVAFTDAKREWTKKKSIAAVAAATRVPPVARVPAPPARPVLSKVPKSEFDAPPPAAIGGPLGKGELTLLRAVAQFTDGATREHLTVLTSYKKSTRNRYIQFLQARGFVREGLQDKIIATEDGIEALGPDYQPLPTGDALRQHLLQTLPKGEAAILSILTDAYPNAVDREAITDATGFQKSTRNRYIQYLASRQLVVYTQSGVKASDNLFD
jgi:hypothetical protein